MSTIVLRLVKGVPLTNAELDDNFSNLNTDKLEAGTTATLTNKTINLSSNTFVATSAQMATAVSDKTGSGALVFATSPTFVTPALGTPASGVVTNLTGTASININGTVGATTASTGAFTTLTTSSTVTLNGGTANGVAFLNGSKVLTTGSTLAFINGNFLVGNVVAPSPSDIPSIEMESAALFGQREFIFACNAYYQSGWKYQGTGFATRYYLDRTNGDHLWQGANSGSAGAGIGFATRMTLTASGVLQLTNNLQLPNNLQFTGTGNRITGDFSNATIASRVAFQTSTVNSSTTVTVIPNGTSTTASILAETDSALTNSTFAQVLATVGEVRLVSGIRGTNTYAPMTFHVGGSERVRIDTSGNVTVGPITTLANSTFVANAGVTARTATASAITPYLQLYNGNSGADLKTWRLGGQGDGSLSFETVNDAYTVGSVKMTITNAGNVGIGTSSPGYKLDVAGVINGSNSIISRRASGSQPEFVLTQTSVSSWSIYNPPSSTNLRFYNGSDLMTLTAGGNLGIGTSSPSYKLDVNSGSGGFSARIASTSTIAALLFNDSATTGLGPFVSSSGNNLTFGRAGVAEYMRIDSSGNVGIGTSSPATKIQVVGAGTTSANYTNGDAAGATLYLQDSGSASGNGGQLLFGSGFGISAGIKSLVTNGTGPAGDLVFQTRTTTGNVTEKMRINDVGNVGIGVTANASAILDVQSTTKGVRMPNMTTTQKNAIASPAAGLMVFDTTLSKLSVYSGAAWQTITSV